MSQRGTKKGDFIQHSFQFRVGARISHRWVEISFIVDPNAQKLYQMGKRMGLIIPAYSKNNNTDFVLFKSLTLYQSIYDRIQRGAVKLMRRVAPPEVIMETLADGMKQLETRRFTLDDTPKALTDEEIMTMIGQELDKQKEVAEV